MDSFLAPESTIHPSRTDLCTCRSLRTRSGTPEAAYFSQWIPLGRFCQAPFQEDHTASASIGGVEGIKKLQIDRERARPSTRIPCKEWQQLRSFRLAGCQLTCITTHVWRKTMNTKKNESIIQLPAGKRYEYFIRKTADFQQIWSLRNAEGWLLLGGNTNAKLIPLWPERIFAEYCNRVNKTECQAESIGLNDFLSKMSKILIRDNIQLAVFPNQNMSAPIRDRKSLSRSYR